MPTIAECVAIATKQCAEVSQSSMPTIAECVAIATKQWPEVRQSSMPLNRSQNNIL